MLLFVRILLVTISLTPQKAVSEIHYFENKDSFSGKDTSNVLITGDNEEITLAIRCIDDELRMLFAHKELIGNYDKQVRIAYKFDDKDPSDFKNSNLLNPSSLSFLGLGDTGRELNSRVKPDKSLLGRLQGAKRLSIRIVDPYDNDQLTTTFELDGIRDTVLKLDCVPSHF